MAAQRCGPDAAFSILVRASQKQNGKLRAIAAEIVDRYEHRGLDGTGNPSETGGQRLRRQAHPFHRSPSSLGRGYRDRP